MELNSGYSIFFPKSKRAVLCRLTIKGHTYAFTISRQYSRAKMVMCTVVPYTLVATLLKNAHYFLILLQWTLDIKKSMFQDLSFVISKVLL